jgi:hypothetical protein
VTVQKAQVGIAIVSRVGWVEGRNPTLSAMEQSFVGSHLRPENVSSFVPPLVGNVTAGGKGSSTQPTTEVRLCLGLNSKLPDGAGADGQVAGNAGVGYAIVADRGLG